MATPSPSPPLAVVVAEPRGAVPDASLVAAWDDDEVACSKLRTLVARGWSTGYAHNVQQAKAKQSKARATVRREVTLSDFAEAAGRTDSTVRTHHVQALPLSSLGSAQTVQRQVPPTVTPRSQVIPADQSA
jgi:hypothetical protein